MIRTYIDALGRTQKAVDGPQGTYLITRKNDQDLFHVWKNDSLRDQSTHRSGADALARACSLAGIDL